MVTPDDPMIFANAIRLSWMSSSVRLLMSYPSIAM